MGFETEKEMVNTIKKSKCLHNLNYGQSLVKEELNGFFGIPDIIIVKKNKQKQVSYAYEAKLSNWTKALTQALRYKAFVNKSYVILDHDRISPAISNTDKFCRANIGLISIEKTGKMHCHYDPYFEKPYSPQLEAKFNDTIANAIPFFPE